MFAVEGHAVVAPAFAHRVFSDLPVGCRINFSDNVPVLKIYIDAFRYRVIARIAGLALKMDRCDDLIFHNVHHGFRFRALVRNIDFVERRRVGNSVRFGFSRKLLYKLHFPEIDHPDFVFLPV